MSKIIFTEDYNEMIELEKLLVKKLKFRWSILSSGMCLLKDKIKDQKSLTLKGGICIFLKEGILSWSFGVITKRSAEKSTIELLVAADVLNNEKLLQNE